MLIYKIQSANSDLVYVGRTTQTLKTRFSAHRSRHKTFLAGKPYSHYCSSMKVLECGDCSIELIERTDDPSREVHWIRELGACNKMKYDHAHRDHANRETRLQKKKAYYQVNREQWKAHYQANRELYSQKSKAYYQANRELCLQKQAEKTQCPKCGRSVSRGHMGRHQKTKKCQTTSS